MGNHFPEGQLQNRVRHKTIGIRGAHMRRRMRSAPKGEQEFSRVADPANIQRIRQTVAGSRDTVYCTGPLKVLSLHSTARITPTMGVTRGYTGGLQRVTGTRVGGYRQGNI